MKTGGSESHGARCKVGRHGGLTPTRRATWAEDEEAKDPVRT